MLHKKWDKKVSYVAKTFFKKNGLLLNWKEFEKLDNSQQINTLAMIAPITNEEKQKLLESISLESKVKTLENIISFYLHDSNSNNLISSNKAIVNDLIFNKSYQPIIIGGFRQNLTQNNIIEPTYKFTGYMDQIKLTVGKANYFDNFEIFDRKAHREKKRKQK